MTLATAFAQVTRPPVNVYDGFEGPSLSNLQDSPGLVAGSATIESSIVRAGHGALRIELRPHDNFNAGIGGVLRITQDLDHKFIVLYEEKRDLRGKWLDLRFEVRFTPQADRVVRGWLDGKQVIHYAGATTNLQNAATGYPDRSYFPFKMGLYRNVMPQPMTIYLDEYRKRELPQ